MNTILANKISKFVIVILAITAVIAPVSQFIDTTFGGKELVRTSKDGFVYVIFLLLLFGAYKKDSNRLIALLKQPINILIAVYGALNIIYFFVFTDVALQARAAGLLFNTRFLVWFGLLQLGYIFFDRSILLKFNKTIRYIGVTLVIFGLVQIFILPPDFFSFLGYEYSSGLSYQTVDNDPNLPRFSSTTRGPNELGAFLAIFITLLVGSVLKLKKITRNQTAMLGLSTVVLYFTYSRSAVVGLALALGLLGLKYLDKKQLAVIAIAGIAVIGGLLAVSTQSQTIQRILFHDENQSQQIDSNQIRLNQLDSSLQDIGNTPFGSGLGSAGPASFNGSEPSVSDNYYVQIAKELGVIGFSLFAAIYVVMLQKLYVSDFRLFAIGVGLGVIALLSHIWVDDLIAYAWWGLSALSIAKHKPNLLPSGL